MESFSAVWQLAEAVFLTSDRKRPIAFMFNEWLATHDASNKFEAILLGHPGYSMDRTK